MAARRPPLADAAAAPALGDAASGGSSCVGRAAGIYRATGGCLLALLGAFIGAVGGIACTYFLLRGAGVNALVWAVTGAFLALLGMPLGIALALLLGRRVWPPH